MIMHEFSWKDEVKWSLVHSLNLAKSLNLKKLNKLMIRRLNIRLQD